MSKVYGETTRRIIELRHSNPCATLQEIGNGVGISREAVRMVLNNVGLPTTHYKQHSLCLNCGKPIYKKRYGKFVPFCDTKCRSMYYRIDVECSICHKLFTLYRSHLLARLNRNKLGMIFCSNSCKGKWSGLNYGFGSRKRRKGMKL